MEEYLRAALEIVEAQASVRTMTDDEITSMLRNVAAGIQAALVRCASLEPEALDAAVMQTVNEYAGEAEQADDITVLTLLYRGSDPA